jgi:tetratricopeptide (TPR) repeat protein
MSRVEVLDDDEPSVVGQRGESEAERQEREQQRADEDGEGIDREACNRLKLRGNRLFQMGNVEAAAELYVKALRRAFVRPFPPRKDPFERPKPPAAEASASVSTVAPAQDAQTEDSPTPADPNAHEYVLTAQVNCNLGACYLRMEKFAEAERVLTEALRHDEAYEKALLRRADSYWHQSKWSSAYGDWQAAEKGGAVLDPDTQRRCADAKEKTDAEMKQMLGQLKDMGNMLLGKFGLSTDNFKFDKDPKTGGYSMRFEK